MKALKLKSQDRYIAYITKKAIIVEGVEGE
jgi:hypothetical protein